MYLSAYVFYGKILLFVCQNSSNCNFPKIQKHLIRMFAIHPLNKKRLLKKIVKMCNIMLNLLRTKCQHPFFHPCMQLRFSCNQSLNHASFSTRKKFCDQRLHNCALRHLRAPIAKHHEIVYPVNNFMMFGNGRSKMVTRWSSNYSKLVKKLTHAYATKLVKKFVKANLLICKG